MKQFFGRVSSGLEYAAGDFFLFLRGTPLSIDSCQELDQTVLQRLPEYLVPLSSSLRDCSGPRQLPRLRILAFCL